MKSKIHEYQKKYLAMSKISKLILAIATVSIFTLTSCRDTKSNSETTDDHGHEHDADGNHFENEKIEQEAFEVGKDTMKIKTETHRHDDGSEHHDHD